MLNTDDVVEIAGHKNPDSSQVDQEPACRGLSARGSRPCRCAVFDQRRGYPCRRSHPPAVDQAATREQRETFIENWHRRAFGMRTPCHSEMVFRAWSKRAPLDIRKMITKWGSCNPTDRQIWINLELAKKSPKALDDVILHELAHFHLAAARRAVHAGS